MTANQYVEAAENVAEQIADRPALELFFGETLYVTEDGSWYLRRPGENVMRVKLDETNTASPAALKRALLSSAVTIERDLGEHVNDPTGYGYRAVLAGAVGPWCGTEAEARDSLLDGLLGVKESV